MTRRAVGWRPVRAGVTVALVLAGFACSGSTTGPGVPSPSPEAPVSLTPVPQTAEWPASTPAAEGIDPGRLIDVLIRIRRREYGGVNSLLVVRNEPLVMEEYFNGWTVQRPHTQQSVTKSVTSLAAGLAVDRGVLSVRDLVTPFFPDYEPIAALDAYKQALTVRDLLMMRTGLDWSEQPYLGSPLDRLNTCACDWIRFVLDWPMREPPGSRWEYVSGGTILLGAVIGRAARTRVDLLLDAELFAPMGFGNEGWYHGLPQGLPHTGGGLSLRPRDMAKLGTLVANGGRWQGRRLVSEAWVRESTQTLPETVSSFAGQPATYGYLWWGLPGGVITAAGARGQWILVMPERRLVVASTAENENAHWDSPVQILYEHILPATQP